jgi:hypothetical protein
VDDWDEDDDPYEPDDSDDQYEPDYDDDPGGSWEPDPEDAEIAKAYEEHAEHCERVHDGGECNCRPSLAERASQLANSVVCRLWGIRNNLTAAARRPCTLRAGPAEVTIRLRADRGCDACSGRGWFYTMTPNPEFPVPEGYNGAALCGCGSAIGKLAETRRAMRHARDEPPF